MAEQSRTIILTESEWETVELALLGAASRWEVAGIAPGVKPEHADWCKGKRRDLMIAVRQIQTQAVRRHDGGPVGTARYSVR